MNILLIGGGGREHTMAWKLNESPLCDKLFILPGNAGTATLGVNLPISITNFEAIGEAVLKYEINMVVVGPEEPLVKGIYDFFKQDEGLKKLLFIGPSANAALLEGSKAFAKAFMNRHGVPTASYKQFSKNEFDEGCDYIKQQPLPIVLKADGLAAGKGVIICNNYIEALSEFELMLLHSKFGRAGERVVVEAFLTGIEMSVFILTDGNSFVLLPEAKDYKRVGEGETGLNTGGMGAISPVPFFNEALKEKIVQRIIQPTLDGLRKEKLDYKGFIFFGLMISDGEPWVIEYNCRMGDPETEVVLPRLKNDFVELLKATADGTLHKIDVKTDFRAASTVVAVSGGYPGKYKSGIPIYGAEGGMQENALLFHSGTKMEGEQLLTNGGRVLAMTAFGSSVTDATKHAMDKLAKVSFEGMYFRRDIGFEFSDSL
ncbi:MAG: phosphoribosylamine--glycine ligase [Ferruginibacter sp.]|nr:phosphoribosylamine--glycine ligase [Ferruginibacter sp.]